MRMMRQQPFEMSRIFWKWKRPMIALIAAKRVHGLWETDHNLYYPLCLPFRFFHYISEDIQILRCHCLQVATRLILSSSPVICWIAALATTPSESKFVPITSADDLDWASKKKEEATKGPEDERGKRERERRLWFSVEKAKNLDARGATQQIPKNGMRYLPETDLFW